MATHNLLGTAGEDAVAEYLKENGYAILHRNWRKNHLELDIVATRDDELIIVEVKTRRNTDYIEPQDAVNWQKIRRIVIAADAYIKHFGIDASVRFDIITAVGQPGAFRIEHIKDAFYPPMFG
ncbi:YraN family protein [Bacteroides heparinolyticus]|uniref:YraN family protein n=1 Tax=Prevotella heparinolytica TaxID=28113 RepID=UPI0023F03EF6|nr:YraN family protein [Bacteroides heparinolyticus]MCF0255528.1 YraN family protein [Bacteroides heparinolyticus]